MRKLLISAILASTVAVAAPAAAQHRGAHGFGYNRGANIQRELGQIERQIDRLRDRRLVSNREAFQLSRQADQIERLADRYARNGLSGSEIRDLQNRIQNLRQRVNAERRDGRRDWRR
jgi:type II secretory pathway component PulJ